MSSPRTGTAVAGLEPVSPLIPDLIWALSSADNDLKTAKLAEKFSQEHKDDITEIPKAFLDELSAASVIEKKPLLRMTCSNVRFNIRKKS